METIRTIRRSQAPGAVAVSSRDGASRQLHLSADRLGDLAVVRLAGELDLAGRDELDDYLTDRWSEGAAGLVLDLSDLAFMDSTGLAILIRHYNRCADRGGFFALVAPRPMVAKVLRITGLINRIPVFSTVESAVAAPAVDDVPDGSEFKAGR